MRKDFRNTFRAMCTDLARIIATYSKDRSFYLCHYLLRYSYNTVYEDAAREMRKLYYAQSMRLFEKELGRRIKIVLGDEYEDLHTALAQHYLDEYEEFPQYNLVRIRWLSEWCPLTWSRKNEY